MRRVTYLKRMSERCGCLQCHWVNDPQSKSDQYDESVTGRLLKRQKPPHRNVTGLFQINHFCRQQTRKESEVAAQYSWNYESSIVQKTLQRLKDKSESDLVPARQNQNILRQELLKTEITVWSCWSRLDKFKSYFLFYNWGEVNDTGKLFVLCFWILFWTWLEFC